MQLHIRGSSNYVLEFASGNESLAELKAKISEVEGSEDVLLYVGGKPLDYEMPVSSIAEFHVDVTVPLLGGKVRMTFSSAYWNLCSHNLKIEIPLLNNLCVLCKIS